MFWNKIKYPNVAIGKSEIVLLLRACSLPNLVIDIKIETLVCQ